MPVKNVQRILPSTVVVEPWQPIADIVIDEVDYPSCDGLPMADNTDQMGAMNTVFTTLQMHFLEHQDVFVAIDLLIYYRRFDNSARVAPDVMVALGAECKSRGSYKLWAEPRPPDWVLEVASEGALARDWETKPTQYARIGVREFWQYDPTGGLVEPRLQGQRLAGGRYVDLPRQTVPGAEIAIESAALGLRLEFDGQRLRFWDPVQRQHLLTYSEMAQARQRTERAQQRDLRTRQ